MSSARNAEREAEHSSTEWSDYLAMHEFLDLSKAGSADRRHRIMLHHCDLGVSVTERAFPDNPEVRTIVCQHVREDLTYEANLADWLEGVDRDQLPKPSLRRIATGPSGIAAMVLNRSTSQISIASGRASEHHCAILQVAEFLWSPLLFDPEDDPRTLSILMNSVGPSIVRRIFGPPIVTHNGCERVAIDFGWIAEAVTMAAFGRIPNLSEVILSVSKEPQHRGVSA
ncbi:MAG: hypothetical protein AAGH53_05620 [Pseudomonadota bacterium]